MDERIFDIVDHVMRKGGLPIMTYENRPDYLAVMEMMINIIDWRDETPGVYDAMSQSIRRLEEE